MSAGTDSSPRAPAAVPPSRLKQALIVLAIFAVGGAVFGSISRTEFSWDQLAGWSLLGKVLNWLVMGAVIGLSQQFLFQKYRGYGHATLVFGVIMAALFAVVEAILSAAAVLTGGWEGGVKSAAVGAVVAVVSYPVFLLVFGLLGKVFGTKAT